MIITDKDALDYGLVGINHSDEKFIYTHAQDIDPTLKEIEVIRNTSDNGWTEDRSMRHIGRIPHIEFLRHPEWSQEPELLVKWLRSPEGAKYRTVTKGI